MSLQQRLVDELNLRPGQKAVQLATKLGVDKREVNSLLYGPLSAQYSQDSRYCWWPLKGASSKPGSGPGEASFTNTSLSRLARYYLACLSQDDIGEVSTWARPFQNDFDYVPLPSLPDDDINAHLQTPAGSQLTNKMHRDRNAKILYLGYPIAINRFTSKAGNDIYRLEPLFLIPVQFEGANNRGMASLSNDFPILNTAVLKRFTNADRDSLMDELLSLEDELGFSDGAEVPELDEVVPRLQALRTEWPWREVCNPEELSASQPIPTLSEPGIYNQAVLMLAERKPYTQGLETELRDLAVLKEEQYEGTALGQLVGNRFNREEEPPLDKTLLEVLPMNLEQRMAVGQALSKQLTIITGPPGTGKSQVVTNLLINAAWQGKKVLFASKNNKAVDVVETRVNTLGPRPLLLRMGSNAYQLKLKEYLQALLSAAASEDEKLEYDHCVEAHDALIQQSESLKKKQADFIAHRNTVDKLEQSIEEYREELGEKVFARVRSLDLEAFENQHRGLEKAVRQADKTQQGFFTRLFWNNARKKRFEQLNEAITGFQTFTEALELKAPPSVVDDEHVTQWADVSSNISELSGRISRIKKYFSALTELQQGTSLEEINTRQLKLYESISANSDKLWKGWLKVSPAKLTASDRTLLSRYVSVLQMITDSGGGKVQRNVWKQYYELTEKVSHLLPCWAVTSLSARGKLPFTAGYYDLVVFDEASQCDVASALPLLYRAKSAVVIGDPKQLPHISSIHKSQDMQLLDRFDLTQDFIQWAYSWNSLFDTTSSYANAEDIVNLKDHHRSHADIINFSNEFFYEGRLRVATQYDRLQRPSRKSPGVRWQDIKGKTIRPSTGSAVNKQEAQAIVEELYHLVVEQRYQGSVGVVTPFRAQANLIKELCFKDRTLSSMLDERGFLCDTVHRFQGDERDVIVFSPVVSEGASFGTTTFLKRSGNLFNVAITRARAMLLVIGDSEAAKSSDVEYLSEFARYVEQLSEEKINSDLHLQQPGRPEYPSMVDRSKVSDWEIVLYKALYEADIRTIPQYPVEQYLLDLAIVIGEKRLDIEVDGERYHRLWTGEYCRRDQIRNQRMYELGWDVLRFWVYEIRDDLDGCVERVRQWVDSANKDTGPEVSAVVSDTFKNY
ncbi:AAA domain-containing protein [Marinobacter sp. SS5-14b]|uniref:AAA domain-containing protein n=1 Tax=Marinobacter sp. SS5-14b TaxID=3050456 RepID=UPI0026E0DBDE|nr:AAA domain-containing protein [Marinobacter sp. SS5-14b]